MTRLKQLTLAIVSLNILFLWGCSSGTSNLNNLLLSCTASGTLVSGSLATAGAQVGISNVSVSVLNGVGPFLITVPGTSQVTSTSTAYTFPGTITMTSAGGSISSSAQVTDTGAGSSAASCPISVTDPNSTTTSYGLSVTSAAGTTNLPLNTPISLTATPTNGGTGYTYSFSISSGSATGVSISGAGSNIASVTSTVTTTVTILVNAYSGTSATVAASGSITLSFGAGGTSTGLVNITASPSTSAPVGSAIYLTASYNGTSSGFTFYQTSSISGVTVTPGSSAGYSSTATVTSSVATSVTITAVSQSNPSITGTITLQFYSGTGGTGGTGALQCTLGHMVGTYIVGVPVVFDILTNTGEPVQITGWYPGENWVTPPTYPLRPRVSVAYSQSGKKDITMQAGSLTRPGVLCNGGAPLTDTFFVNARSGY